MVTLMKPPVEELKSIVGEGNVLMDPVDLYCYSYDSSWVKSMPDVVVRPRKVEEVSEVVKLANKHRIPVHPRGAGTGVNGGVVPRNGGIVIELTRMNKILSISPADLECEVEAGVVLGELEDELTKHGLFYPPDPASSSACTIGGTIATNAGGMRGIRYGVTSNWVLSLEVVLPTGEVVRTGSRALKCVAGYDLTKLFIGSEGTLGIVTKATLKVLPLPEFTARVMAVFDRVDEAVALVSKIYEARVTPLIMEFIDRNSQKAINKWLNLGLPESGAILIVDLDGSEEGVKKQLSKLEKVMREAGAREIKHATTSEEKDRLYQARSNAYPSMFKLGKPNVLVEDITVPVSRLPEAVKKIYSIVEKYNLFVGIIGHIGDGNLHPNIVFDERNRDEFRRVMDCHREISKLALELQGTITGEHGIGFVKADFLPREIGKVNFNLMKQIKRVFDPNGIMNPGVMGL